MGFRTFPFLFFAFLFYLSNPFPNASLLSEVIKVDSKANALNIGKKIDYLILPKTFSALTYALREDVAWTQNTRDNIHFLTERNIVWFRLTLENEDVTSQTFYLVFSSPVIDRFDLFYNLGGRWLSQSSGEQVLQKDKPLYSHIPAFPVLLTAGESRTLYVRLESENPYFSFISILNSKSFLSFSKKSDIYFAAYFGAGGLMFFYSLFLAYSLRYRQFFFYFFYLSSVLLVTLYSTGFMQYIEIGGSHTWKNFLFPVSVYLTSIFGLLFTTEFLELQKFSKKHFKLTLLLISFTLVILPSIFFLDLRTYTETSMTLIIVPISWGIYLTFYSIIKNPRKIENYIFFFAFGSMLVGAAINIATIQGWIKPMSAASFSLPLGSAVEIAFLSIALMLKVRDLRKENEDKQEIDAQLKVAKRLQKDLLPKHRSHLKGFPIGFRYLPTSDIGGDFVHFLEDEKGFGVFLCDVSGHGIAAAMIASMAKVSLQLWVTELSKPALAAERMRTSLLENLSGHFLSAIFLYVNPTQGIMKIANAGHHPIIVLTEEGQTEYISSQGRAITEYITLNLTELELPLPKSGKIILYTDGVLESRDPSNDELFGEERLLEFIRQNAELDPQSLCDRIVGEVFRFSKYKRADDDITLFALGLTPNKAS
jgi:hypothetical protein